MENHGNRFADIECSRGTVIPPARPQKSGKQAKQPIFSVISRPGRCDLQVAPLRMEDGRAYERDADETGGAARPARQSGKATGGEREVIYKKGKKTASRTEKGLEGMFYT